MTKEDEGVKGDEEDGFEGTSATEWFVENNEEKELLDEGVELLSGGGELNSSTRVKLKSVMDGL
jgi:hypothetical protein